MLAAGVNEAGGDGSPELSEKASVNPYDTWQDMIDSAELKIGQNSNVRCTGPECDDAWDSWSNFFWENSSNGRLIMTTNGDRSALWRNEWRALNTFSKWGDNRFEVEVKVGQAHGIPPDGNEDARFTVAQLHNVNADGPPVRIMYGEGELIARSRSDAGSDPTYEDHYLGDISGDKRIVMRVRSGEVVVVHEDERYVLPLNGFSWGGYHWTAGIYLQYEGYATVSFKTIDW